MKKVSVIIPTYNEEKNIGECLKSLDCQTYRDMEVIIIDDGSADGTKEIIKTIHCSLFTVHLLCQQHKGPGEARNLGAKNAKGDILVFVDADMTFAPEFVERLVGPIDRGITKGTFSSEEIVSNWENIWARCWSINEDWEKGKRHSKDYPNHQKVFRAILKSEFDRAGGFEIGGHYNDDWSLSDKLGYEAKLAPDATFYHKNPSELREVFNQSKWVAKRRYKMGIVGSIIALIRVSLPVSVIVGFIKSTIHATPQFIIFKIVYDVGSFLGILDYTFTGRGAK